MRFIRNPLLGREGQCRGDAASRRGVAVRPVPRPARRDRRIPSTARSSQACSRSSRMRRLSHHMAGWWNSTDSMAHWVVFQHQSSRRMRASSCASKASTWSRGKLRQQGQRQPDERLRSTCAVKGEATCCAHAHAHRARDAHRAPQHVEALLPPARAAAPTARARCGAARASRRTGAPPSAPRPPATPAPCRRAPSCSSCRPAGARPEGGRLGMRHRAEPHGGVCRRRHRVPVPGDVSAGAAAMASSQPMPAA